MGNETSRPALYARVSKAIPPVAPQYGINDNIDWVDKGVKAFAGEGDREQFIYGLISLATSNGALNLENHDIKLLFSRRQYPIPPTPTTSSSKASAPSSPSAWRSLMPTSTPEPDDGTRLLATLVAIDEKGVIRVKVEPEADGRNVAEAFQLFKKDVELKLERLLRGVPNGDGAAGGSVGGSHVTGMAVGREMRVERTAATVTNRTSQELVDAPPAYGDVKKR